MKWENTYMFNLWDIINYAEDKVQLAYNMEKLLANT